jgi:hypothetical protein
VVDSEGMPLRVEWHHKPGCRASDAERQRLDALARRHGNPAAGIKFTPPAAGRIRPS